MKTRRGYVSNSSSSSFILEEIPAIAWMTTDDWNGMLRDLYEHYDEAVERHRRFLEDEGYAPDPYDFFCAFDMKTDGKLADEVLGDQLDGWMAYGSCIHDGILEKRDVSVEWEEFTDEVEEQVKDEFSNEHDICGCSSLESQSRKGIRSPYNFVYAIEDGKEKDMPVPEKYLAMLEKKWDELGCCTNRDVMLSDKARFVVHFDENEYCSLKGMDEEEGKGNWETESFTYDRLCEIVAGWLVSHGKAPAGFTWHDLRNATLTVNMHEG